jgi:sarcosine oxidase
MKRYKTIVAGLGAAGSAALYHSAEPGVLGLDKHEPPHQWGSSHGDTRITRQAIGEGSHYTPLSLRSYELFADLERQVNQQLLHKCGGLIISAAAHKASINHVYGFFENTVSAAQEHGIKHEVLEACDIRRRFPQFKVDNDERGYFEPEAGYLVPEAIIEAQLKLAQSRGAEIHTGESVQSFEDRGSYVMVKTDTDSYETEKLVLTVGPWLPQLVPQYAELFKVYREVLYWFDVADTEQFSVPNFPIFIWQIKGHDAGIYGFPAVNGKGGGFKLATETYGATTTPETADRTVSSAEIEKMFREKVKPYFPDALFNCVRSSVCFYTITPDSGFVIDWLGSERVLMCSPCSGHGFKHSAAVGEIVSELVRQGSSKTDLRMFKLGRLLG